MPAFVSPTAFVAPKVAPAFTTGRLVIHSDDGLRSDYTHWWPIFQAQHRVSQFTRSRLVPFCLAINSSVIGDAHMMSWEMVQEILAHGGEVLSHGAWHYGLGAKPLAAAATAGATTIELTTLNARRFTATHGNLGAAEFLVDGLEFVITEGATSETVTPVSYEAGVFTLAAPLVNSFTTAASVALTEAAAKTLVMQKCVSDCAAQGITIKHHVWAWHESSAESRSWALEVFDTASGLTGPGVGNGVIDLGDFDLARLNRAGHDASSEAVDALYDEIQASDGVLIVFGHGDQAAQNRERLAYIISEAIRRGIRIVTHSEAVEHLLASA